MPDQLRERLEAAGFNRGGSCPKPSTTQVRLSALRAVHHFAGFEFRHEHLSEQIQALVSAYAAEAAARSGGINLPGGAEAMKERLLAICDLTWDYGAEDAALVLLAQRLTLRQAMALTYGDVQPGTMREHHPMAGATCVWIRIPTPGSKFQHLQRHAFYVGADADVMSAWGSYLQSLEVAKDSHFIWGPDASTSDRLGWAERRWRHIARRAGFPVGSGPGSLTPSRFRLAWEREARKTSPGYAVKRGTNLSDSGLRKFLGQLASRHGTTAQLK